MKKILLLLILFIAQFTLFAQEKFFNWDISLSTGIPIHSTSTESSKSDILIGNTFNRIIAGTSTEIFLNITKPVKAVAGGDAFCEFIWDGDNHFNSLDYSFYGGVKIFPNLAGFNFEVDYVFGCKTTFAKTDEFSDNTSSSWGNGFRIAIEYDFFYGEESKLDPVVGGYYRYIPRGNYIYDHIIAAYIGLHF